MKSYISKLSVFLAAAVLGLSFYTGSAVFADGEDSNGSDNSPATSISITPVSKILQLSPSTEYEDKFSISNNSNEEMPFEVYASPYSYSYSESEDAYKLGFNNQNNYTQITRWITFQDVNGNYVEKATFKAEPNSSVDVHYKISTPSSIPAGGQYAVLFAHTLSGTTNASGIKTEASPGLVVYGRAEGETITTSEISNLEINDKIDVEGTTKTLINGTSKVKNTGNVDFMASGKLKVTGLFGITYYETPASSTRARISIIPESELVVTDTWDETPYFGLFNVEWTVDATGNSETISKMVLILPLPIIILFILLLTIITIWVIIVIRKRKERRAKFAV